MGEDIHVTSGGCACEYHVKSDDHHMEDAAYVTSSGHVCHACGWHAKSRGLHVGDVIYLTSSGHVYYAFGWHAK